MQRLSRLLVGSPDRTNQRHHSLPSTFWNVPIHGDAFQPIWSSRNLSKIQGHCAGRSRGPCGCLHRWEGHPQLHMGGASTTSIWRLKLHWKGRPNLKWEKNASWSSQNTIFGKCDWTGAELKIMRLFSFLLHLDNDITALTNYSLISLPSLISRQPSVMFPLFSNSDF